MSEDTELLESIDQRLKTLIQLQIRDIDLDDLTAREQVRELYQLGMEPPEIAEALNKSRNNINTQLSRLRSDEVIE